MAARANFFLLACAVLACSSPVAPENAGAADAAKVAVDALVDAAEIAAAGGDAAACPSPLFTASTLYPQPGQTVDLAAAFSASSTTFKWSLTSPWSSTAKFIPDASSRTVQLTPKIVGEYAVCLQTFAANANMHCSECKSLDLSPRLVVELTWHTPGDTDDTDTGPCAGADLDLHVADQLAAEPDQDCDGKPDLWFDPFHDCWAQNPHVSWIFPWAALPGDATLDKDDTAGVGPETTSVWPADGTTYSIGVHAGNDCGFGPSQAKVRVYAYGALAFEAQQLLNPGDMWFVATFTSAGLDVTPCKPQPNVCTDPQKSKLQNEPCLTPCYKPPVTLPKLPTPTACQ